MCCERKSNRWSLMKIKEKTILFPFLNYLYSYYVSMQRYKCFQWRLTCNMIQLNEYELIEIFHFFKPKHFYTARFANLIIITHSLLLNRSLDVFHLFLLLPNLPSMFGFYFINTTLKRYLDTAR